MTIKMIIKWIRYLTLLLLTIIANQNGELIPDRTEVIQKLVAMLNEMRDYNGK